MDNRASAPCSLPTEPAFIGCKRGLGNGASDVKSPVVKQADRIMRRRQTGVAKAPEHLGGSEQPELVHLTRGLRTIRPLDVVRERQC